MKIIIYKNCIEQKDFDTSIQILNRKYSFYITEHTDYIKIYNAIEKHFKEMESCK